MRCSAYCTATSYNIKPLYNHFNQRFKTTAYRDVVHVEISQNQEIAEAFYFQYGATVFWGLTEEDEQHFLKEVREFENQPLDYIEVDKFTFGFGESAKITKDEIILPTQDVLARLAISHGLAQSVKLGTFEIAIQKTFSTTKHIPEDLAKRGRVALSRREIRKKMGDLFIERSSINLRFDVLDTPEFFWEYPELEPLYTMIANYLDISRRVQVLNQRLDVVHELFEMLGNELNHQHSSRLEWTIICLIVIEVALTCLKDVLRWI